MNNAEPVPKHLKIDTSSCILCFKKVKSSEDVINKPTEEGLLSIVKACELRKDEVYDAV